MSTRALELSRQGVPLLPQLPELLQQAKLSGFLGLEALCQAFERLRLGSELCLCLRLCDSLAANLLGSLLR